MIINSSIKNEVKKQAEESARMKECPECRTVGTWQIEVGIINNIISKTRTTPATKDFEHPFDFAVTLTCLQCGCLLIETVERSS